ENDNDANKILFSYGYGPSLPTSAKRVIQLEQPLKVMKTVIMNLQNQEPQKLIRRSPSPPLLIINITSTSNAKSPSTNIIRVPPASQQGKYQKIYKVMNN
ncbi:unnamed protein product, partial [Rotaria sordida]